MDDLLHAWAVFGLRPGSSVEDLRGRYRALAKQWHPDLHMNDPQGQDEAAIQMRVLNSAYERLLVAAAAPPKVKAPTSAGTQSPPTPVPARGRLSREELDHMIASLGTRSYVEGILDNVTEAVPYGHLFTRSSQNEWETTESLGIALAVAGWIGFAATVWQGVNFLRHPGFLLFLLPSVVVAVRRHLKARRASSRAAR